MFLSHLFLLSDDQKYCRNFVLNSHHPPFFWPKVWSKCHHAMLSKSPLIHSFLHYCKSANNNWKNLVAFSSFFDHLKYCFSTCCFLLLRPFFEAAFAFSTMYYIYTTYIWRLCSKVLRVKSKTFCNPFIQKTLRN